MPRLLAFAAVLCLAAPALAADGKFPLTGENTKIEWLGKKADGQHEGGFKKVTGTATVDPADPASLKLDITIATQSIYSDSEKLTAHLMSPDFFSVKQHPKATFKSTKIEKSDKGYKVTGDLTLLGKKKSISFPAKIKLTPDSLSLESEFEIDRTDFGMNYGKGKIDDKVALSVTLDAETK